MNAIAVALMLIAMVAVAASLFIGVFYMTRGREADHAKSNKMMQIRVYLQGFAIAMFVLAMLTGMKN